MQPGPDKVVLVFAPLVYDAVHSRKHAMAQAALAAGMRAVYVEKANSKSRYGAGGRRPALNRPGALVPAADGPEVLAVPKKWERGGIRCSLWRGRMERARRDWISDALARELPEGCETIAIVTSARWWPTLEGIEFTRVVYDKNDEPRVLSGPFTESEYLRREAGLIDRADLIVGPSKSILDAGRRVRPDLPSALIRNGVEWDVFMSRRDAEVPELAEISEPVVGFLGTVASWIDVELIEECAKAHPGFHFPVVGRIGGRVDMSELEALPNVRIWGPVAFDRVPSIMNRFDVCLVPFREGPISESACPVKFYEYLCLGKPIVCTPMPELADLDDLFTMTRDGFVDAVGRAAEEDDEALRTRRMDAGREFGWDRLFSRLIEAIPDRQPQSDQ